MEPMSRPEAVLIIGLVFAVSIGIGYLIGWRQERRRPMATRKRDRLPYRPVQRLTRAEEGEEAARRG